MINKSEGYKVLGATLLYEQAINKVSGFCSIARLANKSRSFSVKFFLKSTMPRIIFS